MTVKKDAGGGMLQDHSFALSRQQIFGPAGATWVTERGLPLHKNNIRRLLPVAGYNSVFQLTGNKIIIGGVQYKTVFVSLQPPCLSRKNHMRVQTHVLRKISDHSGRRSFPQSAVGS